MKAAIDLHIHSCLSACAGKDMTPNNIVNMAYLKGLDIIAVTDHNSVENLPAIMKCAQERNLLVIPGMELETSEEVHLLCYFRDLQTAFEMQSLVYESLPEMKNREDIFGQQLIMDENDEIIRPLEQFLLTATGLSIDTVFETVLRLGGVVVPAHIDRSSYSILSNLGMIPDYLNIKYLEVSKDGDIKKLLEENPALDKYLFMKSSDAHNLGDLLERDSFIELGEITAISLIKTFRWDKG